MTAQAGNQKTGTEPKAPYSVEIALGYDNPHNALNTGAYENLIHSASIHGMQGGQRGCPDTPLWWPHRDDGTPYGFYLRLGLIGDREKITKAVGRIRKQRDIHVSVVARDIDAPYLV
jgi:hypothetical protein